MPKFVSMMTFFLRHRMKNTKKSKVLNQISAPKSQVNSVQRAQRSTRAAKSKGIKADPAVELNVLLEAVKEPPSPVSVMPQESDDSDKENGAAVSPEPTTAAGAGEGDPTISGVSEGNTISCGPSLTKERTDQSVQSPCRPDRTPPSSGDSFAKTELPAAQPTPTAESANPASGGGDHCVNMELPAGQSPLTVEPAKSAGGDHCGKMEPPPSQLPAEPASSAAAPEPDPASGPGAVRLSPVSKYGRVRRARSDAAYVSTDRTYAALTGQQLAPARMPKPGPVGSGARRRAAELRRSLAAAEPDSDAPSAAGAAKHTVSEESASGRACDPSVFRLTGYAAFERLFPPVHAWYIDPFTSSVNSAYGL